MSSLHLCNTHGQVLVALCDIVRTDDPVTLIYLDDEIPLPVPMQTRLRAAFPFLTLHICQDRAMADNFANLPRAFPALIRRNLRWGGRMLQTAQGWLPNMLAGQVMTHAYVHNTGFFMAKVVAGPAQIVTLRESGLNNYAGRPVTGLKRILRLLAGLNPNSQIMGEEPWVDHIAVSRPEDLPAAVRAKGQTHKLQNHLALLNKTQKQTLLHCLAPDLPDLPKGARTALLLTQPLDLVGMCNPATKKRLYGDMVTRLVADGFTVFLKNHPRDVPFTLPQTTSIDAVTPIELWSLAQNQRFDLGVALCSAALAHSTDDLCTQALQLISPDHFHATGFKDWYAEIPTRLDAALAL